MNRVLVIAEHDWTASSMPRSPSASRCAGAIPDAEIAVAVLAARTARPSRRRPPRSPASPRVLSVEQRRECATRWRPCSRRRSRSSPRATTYVLGPSTTFGKDLLPRVAALLGAAQVSDVMAVESAHPSGARSTPATRS